MAAQASNQTADHVRWHMPAAQALQYQALWLEIQGNETTPVEPPRPGSRWEDIVGRPER